MGQQLHCAFPTSQSIHYTMSDVSMEPVPFLHMPLAAREAERTCQKVDEMHGTEMQNAPYQGRTGDLGVISTTL